MVRVPFGLSAGSIRTLLRRTAAATFSLAIFASAAAHAETKTFAVSWFHNATYYGGPNDCPDGLNEKAIDFYKRELLQSGKTQKEIDEVFADFPGNGTLKRPWQSYVVVRGNGKDNVYAHPDTLPDTGHLKLIGSKLAYGFNLDGKDGPEDFEEADTHEKGVDNEVYRVTGCIRTYVGGPPPYRPTWPSQNWEILRDQAPAWLISITTEKGSNEVTLKIDRALERVTRDATSEVRANMTFRVDPDPRSHNVIHGKIENGVIVTDPTDIRIVADVRLNPDFRFSKARLRLQMTPEGNLKGILGGYEYWYPIYTVLAIRAQAFEFPTSINLPMLYHGLKKHADADPDPATGQNRQISTAYVVEAVPAFIAPGPVASK